MKSSTTDSFWRAYHSLPQEIQTEARKAYRLWQQIRVILPFGSSAKAIIGQCASRAAGVRSRDSTKARFIGSGSDHMTNTKDC